jgi:hypothetical protein
MSGLRRIFEDKVEYVEQDFYHAALPQPTL